MNKFCRYAYFALLIDACLVYTPSDAGAETVRLGKKLSGDELRCLHDLLAHYFVHSRGADEIGKLITEAEAARADLRGSGEPAFIFVIHDIGYCGSAGGLTLIGVGRPVGEWQSFGHGY